MFVAFPARLNMVRNILVGEIKRVVSANDLDSSYDPLTFSNSKHSVTYFQDRFCKNYILDKIL